MTGSAGMVTLVTSPVSMFLIRRGEITLEETRHCHAVEIIIDKMTGRSERDGKCTYWKQEKSTDR